MAIVVSRKSPPLPPTYRIWIGNAWVAATGKRIGEYLKCWEGGRGGICWADYTAPYTTRIELYIYIIFHILFKEVYWSCGFHRSFLFGSECGIVLEAHQCHGIWIKSINRKYAPVVFNWYIYCTFVFFTAHFLFPKLKISWDSLSLKLASNKF